MISTRRLLLEELEPRHAFALYPGLKQESLYEFIDDIPPLSDTALRKRYELLARKRSPDGTEIWLNWAIFVTSSENYVGYIQATLREGLPCDIAYVLFQEYWGRGYAREAIQAILPTISNTYNVKTFRALVDTRNKRSINLLLALNFYQNECVNRQVRIRGVLSEESEYILTLSDS